MNKKDRRLMAGSIAAGMVVLGMSTAAGLAGADETAAPTVDGRCKTVAHIGDSTSVGMTDPQMIPDPQNQLPAKYKSIAGVETTLVDSAGGRAVVEQVANATPGLEAMTAVADQADCFVIALGTNDAANVAVGSQVTADQRIDQILAIAAGKPVLWPTVKTTAAATAPGCQPESMAAFNDALFKATERFPNLSVLKWADAAADDLFDQDGIHYTAKGTQARIDAFAAALKQVSEPEPEAPTESATSTPSVAPTPAAETTPVEVPSSTSTAPTVPTVTVTETVTVTAPAPTQ